jgi:hypothetical protein
MAEDMNEINEVSKATQEVAKATTKALGTAEKFGGFVSKYVGGSLEQAMGIFEDKLKYHRWERQERLFMKAQDFMEKEGLERPNNLVALKYAVPLLQAASLEENDGLQDLWAKLLVNYSTANSSIEASRTHIDILERISPLEAEIITAIYSHPYEIMHLESVGTQDLPISVVVLPEKIDESTREAIKIEPSDEVKLALANLDRLGVLWVSRYIGGGQHFGTLNPTLLGKNFFNACTLLSDK